MKLVKNDLYLLLIDEENRGIEYGEVGVNMRHSKLEVETRNMGGYGSDKYYWWHKKCIAYYPLNSEAKEFDLLLLPNPFNLDFNELEWNDIASEDWKIRGGEGKGNWMYRQGYVHGAYKAMKQSKQYSLDDIKKAINFDKYHYEYGNIIASKNDEEIENFIQALSTQQLPKEFVISDKFSTFEENIKNGKYKW